MSSYQDYRLSPDTTPEAEAVFFELLGKKSAAEKLQMVSEMTKTVRRLALSGLRERHPEESEEQLRLRLVELLYGPEIAHRVAQGLNEFQRDE